MLEQEWEIVEGEIIDEGDDVQPSSQTGPSGPTVIITVDALIVNLSGDLSEEEFLARISGQRRSGQERVSQTFEKARSGVDKAINSAVCDSDFRFWRKYGFIPNLDLSHESDRRRWELLKARIEASLTPAEKAARLKKQAQQEANMEYYIQSQREAGGIGF